MHLRDIVWHPYFEQGTLRMSQSLHRVGANDEENKWGWVVIRVEYDDSHIYHMHNKSARESYTNLEALELSVRLIDFYPAPRILGNE